MPERSVIPKFRHRDRLRQIPIFLGKLFRGFIYEKDWKVLPMTAIVAGLVSMVVRGSFFVTMEGTLLGSFAVVCIGIWNGCFNSIQVICRERGIVKREHRSGMHISSYVIAHMIYQALLCLAQTGLSIYICKVTGVRFPTEGFITGSFLIDIGISLFLVSYASDMLSLLISSIARTTTAAMTVMPFLLIFQLVFSGGFFALPEWAGSFSHMTISRYGLNCIAAEADYNGLPMAASWNSLIKLRDEELIYTPTVGDITDSLTNEENPAVAALRAKEIDSRQIYDSAAAMLAESIPDLVLPPFEAYDQAEKTTVGEVIDALVSLPGVSEHRDKQFNFHVKIGDVISFFGEDTVRNAIQSKTAQASYNPKYEHSEENVLSCWWHLILFIFLYALLSIIALEFIDKDKR